MEGVSIVQALCRFRAAALVVLVAGFSSYSTPARAYSRSRAPGGQHEVRWENALVRLRFASGNGNQPQQAQSLLKAAQAAAAAWSTGTVDCTAADLRVEAAGDTNEKVERDGVNRIVFHTRDWCRSGVWRSGGCYDPRIAAMTTLYFADAPNAHGEISVVEADIELNAVNFTWYAERSQLSASNDRAIDLRAALVHEFGHVLGFAHVCDGWAEKPVVRRSLQVCPERSTSVMVPSADVGVLTGPPVYRLFEDDRRGVCALYPADGPRSHGSGFKCQLPLPGACPRTPFEVALLGALALVRVVRGRAALRSR